MKKRLFIIAALAIALVACLGSCKKKTIEPTSNTSSEPTTFDSICHHTSLVHVMAVEPTGEENGCIEHYLCSNCQAAFADAQGTTPIDNTILWATNYVIEDLSEIENYLSMFDTEHGYMYDICLNTISGQCEEGSLWPDYTDWANWTDEQWQAYCECMHQYYIEWGGDEALLSGGETEKTPAGSFISKSLTDDLEKIDNCISSFFDADDQGHILYKIDAKLDTIMLKLDNIQNSIIELSNKMTLQVYKDRMQARYERQVPLGNATTSYLREVLQLVAKEGCDYSQCSAETKAKIQVLAEEWHKQIVNGNNIELEFKNMLDFFKGDFSTGSSMPAIYDYIAEHTFPWAHHGGFAFMEMARAVDAVLMVECYVMNVIYHKTHTSPQFLLFKPINCSMQAYAYTLDHTPIKRYENCFICYIPGASAIVKKELKQVIIDDYLKKLAGNFNTNLEGFDNMTKFLLPNGAVKSDWFTTIIQYYKKENEDQTGNTYLYDKLRTIGFTNVPQFVSPPYGSIIGYSDLESQQFSDLEGGWKRRMYASTECKVRGDKTAWMGFHTRIHPKDGTCSIVKAQVNMEINYGIVTENGDPINLYYAIELYKGK